MFDLTTEIVTFSPRMAHDDTIESLYYANLHAFPANLSKDGDGTWKAAVRKAKNWVVA